MTVIQIGAPPATPAARSRASKRLSRSPARDQVAHSSHVRSFLRIGGVEDRDCLARCTAEELALHRTIDLAEADFIDDIVCPAAVAHLPDHGREDENFNWMRDVLFEDHDVLLLFSPTLDGIEDGVDGNSSLHPRDWFRPFRPLSSAS